MKAAVLRRPGDVAGSPLEMEEVAAPQPGAGKCCCACEPAAYAAPICTSWKGNWRRGGR